MVVIVEEQKQGFHFTQTIYYWSKDLIVCTNGKNGKIILSSEQKDLLQSKGIKILEHKIKNFVGQNGQIKQLVFEHGGQNGQIEQLVFEDGETISREGGFVLPQWVQSTEFGKQLGCENNSMGGIASDSFGRTNIAGVYAAGDASVIVPAQLIIAAAEGSRAAIGVNMDLTQQGFLN